jgi:hypothetical protein
LEALFLLVAGTGLFPSLSLRKRPFGEALQRKPAEHFAFNAFSFAPKLKQAWFIRKQKTDRF